MAIAGPISATVPPKGRSELAETIFEVVIIPKENIPTRAQATINRRAERKFI
jgi:hypothetical protein